MYVYIIFCDSGIFVFGKFFWLGGSVVGGCEYLAVVVEGFFGF